MEIAVIILAGGKSARFSKDKLTYLYKNNPMIIYPIREAQKLTKDVYIITNENEYNNLKKLAKKLNVRFIFDDTSLNCKGPARGISTAVKSIDSDYYLIIPGDIPWINNKALENLVKYSTKFQTLVSPIIHRGIVSPLFTVIPKKNVSRILTICNKYSILASRPSNFIRGTESLLIGLRYITNDSRTFQDVDKKSDLNPHKNTLSRKIVHLKTYNYFIKAIDNFKKGLIKEAFNDFINESKVYRHNRLYSLELSSLIDACIIQRDKPIQKRINWLRVKIGRDSK